MMVLLHSYEFIFAGNCGPEETFFLKSTGMLKFLRIRITVYSSSMDFPANLKEILKEKGLKILSVRKQKVFIFTDRGLVTPLEIVKLSRQD